ncbi:MAG TPA: adenylate/guanylate cyclase domain-containing protein [Actinomycetota bacterium]|nr:adenylate/guanylate cyclase domain-containing protein [Actinomycetota bacterium]
MVRRRGSSLTTVLFTDIVGSSEIAAELGDRRWKALLESHHAIVRRALKRHGGRELDTAGDGFFAVFDRQAEAMRCAVEIVDDIRAIGLEVRAGLHVGETEEIAGKAGGVAVHTGARIGSIAGPGEVMVSGVLRDLVPGSGLEFEDRGARQLKGISEEVRTYSVRAVDGVDVTGPLDPDEAARRRAAAAEPRGRRGSALLVGGIVGAAVIVALVATSLLDREAASPDASTPTIPPIPPRTLVRLDPDRLAEQGRFELSREPQGVVATMGRVWILEDSLLEAVAMDTGEIDRVGISPDVCAIAPSDEGVVLGDCAEHRLYRVTSDLRVIDWHHVPRFGESIVIANSPQGLWILRNREDPPEDRIYRLDPATGDVLGSAVLPGSGNDSFELIEAGASLWTFNFDDGSILRIAPTTLVSATIEEATRPNSIAASDRSVWISDIGPREIVQFNQSGEVLGRVDRNGNLIGAPDGVWAIDIARLFRIDEGADIRQETELPFMDEGNLFTPAFTPAVVADGSLWIAVRSEDEF